MIETLANMADGMLWAIEKCEELGIAAVPEHYAVVCGVYALPHSDGRSTDRETWAGRQHETVTRRSNSGRAMTTVIRRGRAYVHGSHDIPVLLEMSGAKLRGGWDTLAVSRATRTLYHGQIDDLLGTDAMAWSEVIAADRSAVDVHGIARHTADTAGYLTLTSADRDIVHGGDRSHDDSKLSWPTRATLRKPSRRDSDPVETPTALIAGHDDPDRMWLGHALIERAPAKNTRGKLAARTIGAYRARTLADAVAAIESLTLAPRERVTITGEGFDVIVRRSAAARKAYAARIRRDGADPIDLRNASSVGAVATRIARTAV